MKRLFLHTLAVLSVVALATDRTASAQTTTTATAAASTETKLPAVPADYVIGTQDVLSIVFWREKEMSSDVVVRPDGKISLPLINDVEASGLTPEQLRARLVKAAAKFTEDPIATVVVKEIKSRQVFVTGSIAKPGSYALIGQMNILQLIALAGGLDEFSDSEKILVVRQEAGKTLYLKFNYKEVIRQKNVEQNIALKPGDTIVIP